MENEDIKKKIDTGSPSARSVVEPPAPVLPLTPSSPEQVEMSAEVDRLSDDEEFQEVTIEVDADGEVVVRTSQRASGAATPMGLGSATSGVRGVGGVSVSAVNYRGGEVAVPLARSVTGEQLNSGNFSGASAAAGGASGFGVRGAEGNLMLAGSPVGDALVPRKSSMGLVADASVEIAERHARATALTEYRPDTDQFVLRSVWGTTREQLGEYGSGIRLYFDLLVWLSVAFFFMSLLSLPQLVISYMGDFGGNGSSFFTKLTIGNLGICGTYGEYCSDTSTTPYRVLLSDYTYTLREITPYFGALDALGGLILFVTAVLFAFVKAKNVAKAIDVQTVSPQDFAIQVDWLPRKIAEHSLYAEKLKAHFERVTRGGKVVEVTLVRDYQRAISVFMSLGEIRGNLLELRAQLRAAGGVPQSKTQQALAKASAEASRGGDSPGQRKRGSVMAGIAGLSDYLKAAGEAVKEIKNDAADAYVNRKKDPKWKLHRSLEKQMEKLELQMARLKLKLRANRNVVDSEREVVTAFVIFDTEQAKEQALHKYRWANWSHFFRLLQSSHLRFEGAKISCRQAEEPSDIYQENLDLSNSQKRSRKIFTTIFAILLLLLCVGLIVWAQSSLQSVTVSSEAVNVWVLAPLEAAAATGTAACFSACDLQVYTDGLMSNTTLMDSSLLTWFDSAGGVDNSLRGMDSVGIGKTEGSSTACTGTGVWFPKGQCAERWSAIGGPLTTRRRLQEENVTDGTVAYPAAIEDDLDALDDGNSNSRRLTANDQCLSAETEWTVLNKYGTFISDPSLYYGQLQAADFAKLQCDANVVDPRVPRNLMTVEDWATGIAALSAAYVSNPLTDAQATYLQNISPACATLFTISTSRAYCRCSEDFNAIAVNWPIYSTITTFDDTAHLTGSLADFALYYDFLGNRLSVMCDLSGKKQDKWRPISKIIASATLSTSSVPDDFVATVTSAIQGANTIPDDAALEVQLAGFDSSLWTAYYTISLMTTTTSDDVSTIASKDADLQLIIASIATNDVPNVISGLLTISVSAVEGIVYTRAPLCSSDEFMCPVVERCINTVRVCDSVPDCEKVVTFDQDTGVPVEYTGSHPDEALALCAGIVETDSCDTLGKYSCTIGGCIEDTLWCDGVSDCADSSDETNDECIARNAFRDSLSTPTAEQWLGFRGAYETDIKSIRLAVPAGAPSPKTFKLFGCDETLVFRHGQLTIRDPYNLCRPLATVAFDLQTDFDELPTPTDASMQGLPWTLESGGASCEIDLDCSSSTTGKYCYSKKTGEFKTDINHPGVCLARHQAIFGATTITYDASSCPMDVPVSIVVARSINNKYGTDETDKLNDETYRCFCEQQVQYNVGTDSLYIFGPYDTEEKIICEPYLEQQVYTKIALIVAIAVVALLNVCLRETMLFLAKFEKHQSFSDQVFSEMWKLFVVLFVNTTLIILLVNARFGGLSNSSVIGFGGGAYPDLNKTWFVVVGASFSTTIIVQTLTMCLMPPILSLISKYYFRFYAKRLRTQEKMNKAFEYPDFSLSLRLAQTVMIVCSCTLYSSGVPCLNFLGFTYCVFAYWVDKYVLLRFSKLPPRYEADMVVFSAKLIPFGVLLHAAFAVWMLGNQAVFPSEWINDSLKSFHENRVNVEMYSNYLFGTIPDDLASYEVYISGRVSDSFRIAAGPDYILGFLCVLYFTLGTIWSGMKLVGLFMAGIFRCKKSKTDFEVTTDERYTDAKSGMIRNRILHTYEIAKNPMYIPAYRAIVHVDAETAQIRSGGLQKSGTAGWK